MIYIPLSKRKGNNPHEDIDSIMERISSVESGGKYDALGPKVEKGMYAGEQALGKYQVMPGNIPSWSKEALGYEVTPEQFLADPELQESIVRDRMSKIYQQYKNGEDVASVWFTGRPRSEAGGEVADVTGTSNDEYIRRFNNAGTQSTKLASSDRIYTPLRERKMV